MGIALATHLLHTFRRAKAEGRFDHVHLPRSIADLELGLNTFGRRLPSGTNAANPTGSQIQCGRGQNRSPTGIEPRPAAYAT